MPTPTQLTLKHFRALGYTVAVTERWNPHARVRQDLFGFIDLIAIRDGETPLAIQATSRTNHAARRRKSAQLPELQTWLATGARFSVASWRKIARGKHQLFLEEITL